MTTKYHCKENDNMIKIVSDDSGNFDQIEFKHETDPGWIVIGHEDLKAAIEESPVELYSNEEIIEKFFKILRMDKEYFRSWKDNIAMEFKDIFTFENKNHDKELVHKVSNLAAESFLCRTVQKPGNWMEDAERLYRHMNPGSNMDVPSSVYETVKKWNNQWQITDTRLSFFDWCVENKW